MNKFSFDNAFLGAKVIKNKKEFYVYKINQKTFYFGVLPYATIKARWENKTPDLTWKLLMDSVGAKSSEYEGFFLADEQDAEIMIKRASEEKKEKKYLSKHAEAEVFKLFERFKTGKGSWRHQTEVSKEIFNIVEAKQEGVVLLAIDGHFVFFELHSKKYTYWRPIRMVKDGSKEVPWPKVAA